MFGSIQGKVSDWVEGKLDWVEEGIHIKGSFALGSVLCIVAQLSDSLRPHGL